MGDVNVIVFGVLGAVVVFLVAAGFWIRRLRARARVEVEERFRAEGIRLIDAAANCFGLESKGMAQIRGNGCLAATPREVYFQMWVPKREIAIPRDEIVEISTPRSHLGKSRGVKLLKIAFTTPEGEKDSAAWIVRDLDAWLSELR